jgi:hypothetical protein
MQLWSKRHHVSISRVTWPVVRGSCVTFVLTVLRNEVLVPIYGPDFVLRYIEASEQIHSPSGSGYVIDNLWDGVGPIPQISQRASWSCFVQGKYFSLPKASTQALMPTEFSVQGY